jgi:hypothetical protein
MSDIVALHSLPSCNLTNFCHGYFFFILFQSLVRQIPTLSQRAAKFALNFRNSKKSIQI